jgi:SWI/SNF-related matrix-associated actin-dependent regulator 1 of chromatin subfamily A
VVALTGTPVLNGPVELYPLLHRICPDIAPSWAAYTQRYCPPVARYIGALNRSVLCYDQGQNLTELGQLMRERVLVRPDAAMCRLQLPTLIRDDYRLRIEDPSGGIFTAEELTAVFSEEGAEAQERQDPMVAELRRLTGMAKAEAAIPWLSDLIEGGEVPIIWCWHQSVAEHIANALRLRFIHGGVPFDQRRESIRQFISGEAKGLVCTIGAAGQGLDGLQASGSLAIFMERSYVPADNEQAECRLYRAGQTRGVRVVVVCTSAVIDHAIANAISRKTRTIQEILQ